MKLNELSKYKTTSKRLGRGRATGKGKTSGRGTKGQKARTGKKIRAGFEGGQTPIFQRLPKYRGFTNPNHINYQVINVSDLESLSEKKVDMETLLSHRLITRKSMPVKLLGNGELSKAFTVELDQASKSAIEKITKAGGSFISTMKPSKKADKATAKPSKSTPTPQESTVEEVES